MSDTIPVAQLRAFVERIERIEADIKDLNGDKMARLRYVLLPLSEIAAPSIASRRAEVAGARLLGVRSDDVRHRAKTVRRRGSVEACIRWLAEFVPGDIWGVPNLPEDAVRMVYLAEATDFPGIYKVGFSGDPERRRKELEAQHGIRLRVIASSVGTEFDEHLIQHRLVHYGMANEWFDISGRWSAMKPLARFHTPDRMWSELREAA